MQFTEIFNVKKGRGCFIFSVVTQGQNDCDPLSLIVYISSSKYSFFLKKLCSLVSLINETVYMSAPAQSLWLPNGYKSFPSSLVSHTTPYKHFSVRYAEFPSTHVYFLHLPIQLFLW